MLQTRLLQQKGNQHAIARTWKCSLWVGDLHPAVTAEMLLKEFSKMGNLTTVRVCPDMCTGRSLGYAYVNFSNHNDALHAFKELNGIEIYGRSMRIMWSDRNPAKRRSVEGNV